MIKDMKHKIYHLDHFQVYSAVRLTFFVFLRSHLREICFQNFCHPRLKSYAYETALHLPLPQTPAHFLSL